jgi:hypothetical protein
MKDARWPESVRDVLTLTAEDHAARTTAAMNWLNVTGPPIKLFPFYGAMVSREVSVAIGWEPWPTDWPTI